MNVNDNISLENSGTGIDRNSLLSFMHNQGQKNAVSEASVSENALEYPWSVIYANLKKRINPQFFSLWFHDLKAEYDRESHALKIFTRNPEIANHLRKRYIGKIKEEAALINPAISVEITLHEEKKETAKVNVNTLYGNKESAYPNRIELNPLYTFDRFIRGPSNDHAFAAALGASENPSGYHNPLYLYGEVGLGKTHLMMAIGNHIRIQYPTLRVKYTPAEIFQTDLVEAMHTKTMASFKSKYRNVDILLIDDIQFISERAAFTQEEVFNTFNYLYQNKKQIVISADRPPAQLKALHDRLQSRFQSGLIVDIKAPNFETRLAILRSKAAEMNLAVGNDVMRHLASQFTSHIRILEAALIKLQFTSTIENRPVDMQMAKLALRDLPAENNQSMVTIDEILRIVSRTFHLDEADIKGMSRVENVALARHICMYMAKKLIKGMSLAAIAQAFGKTDHTTVIHAERKISEMIDKDEAMKIQIQEMITELQF